MNWSAERYARLYTRDTSNWVAGPWQARALLPLVLRKLDRAGTLDLDDNGLEGLAAMVGLPLEVVEAGMAWWAKKGTLVIVGTVLTMPNYVEAQECKAAPALRSKDYRDRKSVTQRDGADTPRIDTATQNDHASHGVTPSRTVPSLAKPGSAQARAAPGAQKPDPSSPVLRHRAPERGTSNRHDDGCFGAACDAFEGGVRAATGRPVTRLGGGAVGQLLAVFDAHFPTIATREADVRSVAEAFARAETTHTPWRFGDWLDRGRKTAREAALVPPGEAPGAEEARRHKEAEREAQRVREERRARAEAVPIPAELVTGLKPPPGPPARTTPPAPESRPVRRPPPGPVPSREEQLKAAAEWVAANPEEKAG